MGRYEYDTLRAFILDRTKRYSKKVAVEFYNKEKQLVEITYEKMESDIASIGTFLLDAGYQKEKIAIISENSYDWIRLFFGISFSGNIAVPIARDSGAEIIADNLKNTECNVVFYSKQSKKLVESIISENPDLIKTKYLMTDLDNIVEEGQKLMAAGNASFNDVTVLPDDTAAIYFTSGTTGSQKGVVLTQNNFVFDTQSAYEYLYVSATKTKILVVLPLTHVLSFCLMCNIFNIGAKGFVCKSLKSFLVDITTQKPDILGMVPMFLEVIYKEVMSELQSKNKVQAYKGLCKVSNLLLKIGIDLRPVFFKQIREKLGGNLDVIITGGAPVNQAIVDEFHNWGVNVVVGYGITECAPIISVSEYKESVPNSVGKVINGVEVIIDNPDEKGIGEICVKGPIVMKEYCNNPEETAKALAGGMFHTGDLGYLDKNNYVFITGRSKNLIILSNGENISPEMLENKIIEHTVVKEVVVYQEDDNIVAEIFPNDSFVQKNNITDLKAYIEDAVDSVNKKLPAYARIGSVKIRDEEFPKNVSNKIKRNYDRS